MMAKKVKLCLVSSSGGHFSEIYLLKRFWEKYDHFWVTFDREDTEFVLKSEKVYFAYQPTNRNFSNFFRNFFLAIKLLRLERPDFVISTGAGVGVPFIYAAKVLKIKTIFIETLARVEKLSLSGKLAYYSADHFIAQWPHLGKKYKKAVFKGQII